MALRCFGVEKRIGAPGFPAGSGPGPRHPARAELPGCDDEPLLRAHLRFVPGPMLPWKEHLLQSGGPAFPGFFRVGSAPGSNPGPAWRALSVPGRTRVRSGPGPAALRLRLVPVRTPGQTLPAGTPALPATGAKMDGIHPALAPGDRESL